MYLLDTNIISELRKAQSGRADEHVVAWAGSVPVASLFLSVITILELEVGILLEQRRDLQQGEVLRSWLTHHVLSSFADRIIPIDLSIAQCCAHLHIPNPRADRDALIAATALIHHMTLVTRNVSDFHSIDIKIINPWDFKHSTASC